MIASKVSNNNQGTSHINTKRVKFVLTVKYLNVVIANSCRPLNVHESQIEMQNVLWVGDVKDPPAVSVARKQSKAGPLSMATVRVIVLP